MGSQLIGIKPSGQADFRYGYVPTDLMKFIARRCEISTFVETGTEFGNTSAWAAIHFKRVFTFETSQHFIDFAKPRLEKFGLPDTGTVTLIEGESHKLMMKFIRRHLGGNEKVLWWLDAHYTHAKDSENYYESETQPLLSEISAILCRDADTNFIFIDDARFIVYPFTPPGSMQSWPSLWEVMEMLEDYFVVIYGDSIVAIPHEHYELYDEWKREIKGTQLDIL